MEDEGIMALPQGMPMTEGQDAAPPVVTSADSYDAAQTALGMVNPDELAALKDELRMSMGELQLSPAELNQLIEIFENLSQNPGEYPRLREEVIQKDIVDPEDLPEQYDPEYLGMVLVVLNELKMSQVQGAQAPMMSEPPAMGPEPMAMASGGLADMATYLASKGRNGDTMLAHITPEEAQLLQSRGGSGTINPSTGLPEFFLKKLFKGIKNAVKKVLSSKVGRVLATVGLALVLGPAGVGLSMATAAGVAGAGTTLMAGGSVKDALIAGAMGYIGGGGTIMGASPVSAVGQYLPGAAGTALNTGLSTAAIGTGVGMVAGMKPLEALKMGAMSGASAAALQGLQGTKAGEIPLEGRAPISEAVPMPRGETGIGQLGTAQDVLAGQGAQVTPLGPDAGAAMGAPTPNYLAYPPPGEFTPPTASGAPTPNYLAYPPPGEFVPTEGDYYKQIGINPDKMVAQAGPRPSNVAIERGTLGMTGLGDSARQLMKDPVAVATDFYNQNLSPNRPGLPSDAGLIRRYAPLAAAGTAVLGATGGFKGEPANPAPLFNRSYGGLDFIRDNPEMFKGGLDFGYVRPNSPPSSVVPPPLTYNTIPVSQPTTAIPMGVTNSPQGVLQPYNVSGLYGVPMVYQPPVRRYAEGGQATQFPRKTGPINGPGTGTSDSIPAMLSDGEFVFTARAVRNAGNGSRRKGAARMYKLMKMLEGGPVKAK